MPTKLSHEHLLLISKGTKAAINNFRLGAYFTQVAARPIDALKEDACRDRFEYAEQMLRCSKWALKATQPHYRVAVARAYYAMYHAARAAVFFVEGGDDHEPHLELPKHIPSDFPDRATWQNTLRDARLERNRADYDPYPKTDRAFRKTAETILGSRLIKSTRL